MKLKTHITMILGITLIFGVGIGLSFINLAFLLVCGPLSFVGGLYLLRLCEKIELNENKKRLSESVEYALKIRDEMEVNSGEKEK